MDPKFEKIACSTMSSSSANDHRLVQLEQVLLKWLPESVHMLNLCRIMKQQKFHPNALVQFYVYVEDDDSNWDNGAECPFVVCIETNWHTDNWPIYNALQLDSKKGISLLGPQVIRRSMLEAFDSFVGWDEPHAFTAIPYQFGSVVRELCILHKNLNAEDNEGIPCVMLSLLDIERAKNLEIVCKPNITIKQLEQKNAAEVARNWKWAQEHTEREIEDTIKTLPSCGAFSEDGEMLSSVLISSLGMLNVLWTPEKFRRMGYGHLVMKAGSKWAAEKLGIYPLGTAQDWNIASIRTMEKLGYEKICKIFWFYFNPSTQSMASRTEGHH